MRHYYIALVQISPGVLEHIAGKHGVTQQDVKEAFELTTLRSAHRDVDDDGQWRLLVTGTTYDGRDLDGVIYPVDETDGLWALATAFWAT